MKRIGLIAGAMVLGVMVSAPAKADVSVIMWNGSRICQIWDNASVLKTLDGQTVKIPGYVVPLEAIQDAMREFLLVPYFGACIHSPPPPANQIVHVTEHPAHVLIARVLQHDHVRATVHKIPSGAQARQAGAHHHNVGFHRRILS